MKSGRWKRAKGSEHRLFTLEVAWALSVGLVGEGREGLASFKKGCHRWEGSSVRIRKQRLLWANAALPPGHMAWGRRVG